MQPKIYKLFGLIVSSEIDLSGLIPIEMQTPEVFIKKGYVPNHLPITTESGPLFELSPNDFLLRISEVARYRVRDGIEIVVAPEMNSNEEEVRLFLFGSVFGSLLIQRGHLPIHGSAFATKKGAIIITGPSSVGKSTLAASLGVKGFQIISDDIASISKQEGNYIISPGLPYVKLWKDVIVELKNDAELKRVRPSIEKYVVPIQKDFFSESMAIRCILFLSKKNTQGFTISEIKGKDKFHILRENTYRKRFVDGLGQTSNHFQLITGLVTTVPFYKVERPTDPLLINELSDFVINNIVTSN